MEQETAPPAKAVKRPSARSLTAKRNRFIKVLRDTGNVSRAAKAAGIPSSSAYRQRARIIKFREQWDDALNEALDNIEEVLLDRAVNGVERQHFHGGEVTGTYRTYSDSLAMFILRGRRPEIYGTAPAQRIEEDDDSEAVVVRQLDRIAARVRARDAERVAE